MPEGKVLKQRDRHLDRLNDSSLLCDRAYIDGEWCEGDDDARFDVTNPADGAWLAAVSSVGAAQSLAAVDAVDAAAREWSESIAPGLPVRRSHWAA